MESFSGALAKHAGYKKQLTPSQYDAVNLFMRNVILDKIDQEVDLSIKRCRGVSPYDWIGAIVTYGTVYQNLSKLWENWWRVTSKGRAIAMLKYVSGLMYAEKAVAHRPCGIQMDMFTFNHGIRRIWFTCVKP